MTSNVDLMNEIKRNLTSAVVPSLTSANNAHDLYEAYVFTLVLKAARRAGYSVRYERINSVQSGPQSTFFFRTSPGHIFTATQPYGFAVLVSNGFPRFEVHLGVRVLGKSHVSHECDVLIIDRKTAEACRERRRDPRHSRASLAIECKFYSSSLPLGQLRGFLGLSLDLGAAKTMLVTNVEANISMARYLRTHKRWSTDRLIPPSHNVARTFSQWVSSSLDH